VAALDMMQAAERAMVPPFAISRFADPAGSFTTAAAMVACVERKLKQQDGRALRGVRVVVFGATGVVGFASGVIAALEGAEVTLAGHDGAARVGHSAEEIGQRFGVTVRAADASTAALKLSVLQAAEIALCAGRAGTQILSTADLQAAPGLRVVADVNAVPPLGVEGLDVMADGAPLGSAGAVGIGALAIGHIKYRTEFAMFQRMIKAEAAVALDFRDAFALARELVA
jgi:methylene-tetrahydromethanopterin dehydrogenase